MTDRSALVGGIILVLMCLLGPGSAQATVKCQCNNGTVAHAMNSDYDDDDLEESCNDACSMSGGGRVWSVESDRDDDDVTIRPRGTRPPAKPEPRRR
jgi:hypothetical protein